MRYQFDKTYRSIFQVDQRYFFYISIILMASICGKQVTKNMTGLLKNIWMFCITIEHKSVATFFLKYCKNITHFLFWVFWTCLATSIKKGKYQHVEALTFICVPKMILIPNFFFEILQRYCKFVTLSNLKTLDHAH